MGSTSDLVQSFFLNLLSSSASSTLDIPFANRNINKKTGAQTDAVRLNNGIFMSRVTTKTGAQWDSIHRPPVIRSKADLDNAIVDYYKNGLTQDQTANELGCSQSYVSNTLRRYRESKK